MTKGDLSVRDLLAIVDVLGGDDEAKKLLDGEYEGLVRKKLPSVSGLINDRGSFTGNRDLIEYLISRNFIFVLDKKTLYVDMSIMDNQPGCICGFSPYVECVESVTRDLLEYFKVEEVVYFNIRRRKDQMKFLELDSGYKGRIDQIPRGYEDDPGCGNYPLIKGISMRWVSRHDL